MTTINVLHIAAGSPSSERPYYQPFIKTQIDSLRKNGVNIEVVDIKGYQSVFNYIKAIFEVRKICSSKKIQLIHAHYSYCGLVSLLANVKLPIVVSIMGGEVQGSPNFDGKYTLRGKFDRLLTNLIINKFDFVIVKSRRIKNFLKTNIPVEIIPNGVDLDQFKPSDLEKARLKLNLKKNDFIILFLGSKDISIKNYLLAEASVKMFVEENKLSDVQLLNPFGISHSQVADYMNASDVLLITSFYEGSPNVVKEAMACNLPVISTDVGDVREIIDGARNCFITDFSKIEIAEKLKLIYNNRERTNGRDKIQNLSSDLISRKIIAIYNHLTAK